MISVASVTASYTSANGKVKLLGWFSLGCGKFMSVSAQPGFLVPTLTHSNYLLDFLALRTVIAYRFLMLVVFLTQTMEYFYR